MISIQKCRVLLGNPDLSDYEVELIRNFFYQLCELKIKPLVESLNNNENNA